MSASGRLAQGWAYSAAANALLGAALGGALAAPGAAAAGLADRKLPRPGFPPKRPPDKLSQSVDPVLEEVGPYTTRLGGHAALRVAHQPEGLDVPPGPICPATTRVDDVPQVLVIGLGPHPRRRVRGGDHQTVLVLVVEEREVVALPVARTSRRRAG